MKLCKNIVFIMGFLTTLLTTEAAGPHRNERVGLAKHSLSKERILKTLQAKLPNSFTAHARTISHAIMEESSKHKLDPLIIAAVIAGESAFNPSAIGPIGEIGLMQLRPNTARWIAKKSNIPWLGQGALKNPTYNIRLGVAYLGYLKKRFSPRGGNLYLTAYNMGETTLVRLLSNKIEPYIYSRHIMKNYIAIND